MKNILTTIALTLLIATALIINSCKEDVPETPAGTNNKITLTLTTDTVSYTFANFDLGINYVPKISSYETGICYDTITEPTIDGLKTGLNKITNLQTNIKADVTNQY